jgi:hypothetical protein
MDGGGGVGWNLARGVRRPGGAPRRQAPMRNRARHRPRGEGAMPIHHADCVAAVARIADMPEIRRADPLRVRASLNAARTTRESASPWRRGRAHRAKEA